MKIPAIPNVPGALLQHRVISVPNGKAPYIDGSIPMDHYVEFFYPDCIRKYEPQGTVLQDRDWSIVAVRELQVAAPAV